MVAMIDIGPVMAPLESKGTSTLALTGHMEMILMNIGKLLMRPLTVGGHNI
jgi:hypothetical protein